MFVSSSQQRTKALRWLAGELAWEHMLDSLRTRAGQTPLAAAPAVAPVARAA